MRYLAVALLFSAGTLAHAAEWSADVETGAVWAGYADVRVPNATGDTISFTDDLDAEVAPFGRLRLGMHPGGAHHLYIELAPLTVRARGSLSSAVDFAGTTFPADTELSASYQFNTYRLLYRYGIRNDDEVRSAWGAALLVRDARLRITGGGLTGVDDDLGLVPLLGYEYARRLNDAWWFVFDINAAAASQGRAEDLFLGVKRTASERFEVNLGYRLIEGGADVDQVYTFTALNHVVVGATIRF
jgi:hypothetical protein